jgi:hypothetical protein
MCPWVICGAESGRGKEILAKVNQERGDILYFRDIGAIGADIESRGGCL